MYRVVRVFKTADGRTFDSKGSAIALCADMCGEILDQATKGLVQDGKVTRSEQLRFINTLVPDAATFKLLLDKLNACFLESDHNEEDYE